MTADTTITKSCAKFPRIPPRRGCFFTSSSVSHRYLSFYNTGPWLKLPYWPMKFGLGPDRDFDNTEYEAKFTCSDICTTDGCNTAAIASGTLTEEGLYCIICSYDGGGSKFCSSKKIMSPCPGTATHCRSTVVYYFAIDYNQMVPLHQIARIVRECASEAVEPHCSTSTIAGSEVEVVTCTETCRGNGCNIGWPARPMCSQCSITQDDCEQRPPVPSPCPSPIYTHCTIRNQNAGSVPGYATGVTRGCSYGSIATSCSDTAIGGMTMRNCQLSCNTTKCNQGLPPSSL